MMIWWRCMVFSIQLICGGISAPVLQRQPRIGNVGYLNAKPATASANRYKSYIVYIDADLATALIRHDSQPITAWRRIRADNG
jgi:hypothetical protein